MIINNSFTQSFIYLSFHNLFFVDVFIYLLVWTYLFICLMVDGISVREFFLRDGTERYRMSKNSI